LARTFKKLPDWLAEEELKKHFDDWLPYIAGISTIPAEEVEFMTGKQKSILNAAARMRIKLLGGGFG